MPEYNWIVELLNFIKHQKPEVVFIFLKHYIIYVAHKIILKTRTEVELGKSEIKIACAID